MVDSKMISNPLFRSRLDCPICGTDDPLPLRKIEYAVSPVWDFVEVYYEGRVAQDALRGAFFEVVKCHNCSFVWQQHILNEQGMGRLYNDWISTDDSLAKKRETDVSLYAGYARQIEAIAYLLKRKPADIKVLDFGMGWGYWVLMAQAYGFQAYGFEIAVDRLAYARQFGLQVTDDTADFEDIQFDFINSEQAFEHIPTPKESIEFLVSKLKRGGILRISVPNGNGIAKAVQRLNWKPAADAIHPLEHINCFTNKTLIHLAKLAGLELAEQPWLLGQGLLGKSYGVSAKSWLTSLVGRYYRRYWGTTLYFYLPK